MQVRLILEGVTPEYPWTICDGAGLVMARFKTDDAARTWSALRRFDVVTDTFPNYAD